MTAPAVEAVGLRKTFGRLQVLQGLDVAIEAGVVTAIVGPNAAGKSTFIKSVLGLVRPDSGQLRVLGADPRDGDSYRARVGYMPQTARFPENLSGNEVLQLLSGLRGHPESQDRELIDTFGLGSQLHKPVRTLSGGTRQKLNAIVAFLFRPALVILDEPTAGLDPVASGQFKDKVLDARSKGTTVLLTSHLMGEVEELADRIVFLLEGRIHFHGSVDELRQRTGEAKLERAVARLTTEAA
ncbi:MAG: ABC transporter ATP-binding protein [Gemmatimonadales bacterium]|nr:ABC transporter ATP-binding protein [Gemmatimonadales bacterium]